MSEATVFGSLLWGCFGLAALTLASTLFITAPYGRHGRAGWGPTIGGTAGWILMESPAVVTMAVLFLVGRQPHRVTEVVFLALWQLHYLHRTVVYPLRRHGRARPMPVAIPLMGVVFNTLNGYLNGRYLFTFGPARGVEWFGDPRFLLGVVVFFAGMAINLRADEALLNLRKPGETGYAIPTGGMFRWVTSPNYFGEIVEWLGFALLTWSPAALAFAVYTASNLGPRALSHHRWYQAKFHEYPVERRALIPFVL